MPIKVNYKTIGFVLYKNFKMLYDDILDWRTKNSLFKDLPSELSQTMDLEFYHKDTITNRAD